MKLAANDHAMMQRQLEAVARAVEELLLSGLTTASAATRETFEVTFREASRLRLLRLASTLRAANEEIGRFVNKQPEFSGKRMSFFLNRAWLLARGLLRALANKDEAEWDRLVWTQPAIPVPRLEVVTLGVGKKVAKGSFCAFEFRLRRVGRAIADVPSRLVWSCVFPLKADVEIPPEGFLQMPQKQKFKALTFLEGRSVVLTQVMMTVDASGCGRVSLTDNSTVTQGEVFTDWAAFSNWSPEPLHERVRQYEPSPFDLEIELQDEVVLQNWSIQERLPDPRDGQLIYPVSAGPLNFEATVAAAADGQALDNGLNVLREQTNQARPPLFGLLHFERCQFILQPLSVLKETGPEYLTIATDKIDRAALLKTLKF